MKKIYILFKDRTVYKADNQKSNSVEEAFTVLENKNLYDKIVFIFIVDLYNESGLADCRDGRCEIIVDDETIINIVTDLEPLVDINTYSSKYQSLNIYGESPVSEFIDSCGIVSDDFDDMDIYNMLVEYARNFH